MKTARPGLPAGDVDAAARKVITDDGCGPASMLAARPVGHGLGMDEHVGPDLRLVKGNPLPLEPDMTFSDRPEIYIRGEFGVRLEDDMHISGSEPLFAPQSPSPRRPFRQSVNGVAGTTIIIDATAARALLIALAVGMRHVRRTRFKEQTDIYSM